MINTILNPCFYLYFFQITYSARDWKENHEKMLADMREAKRHNRPNSALDNVEILTNQDDNRRRGSRGSRDSRDSRDSDRDSGRRRRR